jgi:hypothetical protein
MRTMIEPAGENPAPHSGDGEKKFHVWRLLGVIAVVIGVLGLISFMVDLIVIGPLRGRLY